VPHWVSCWYTHFRSCSPSSYRGTRHPMACCRCSSRMKAEGPRRTPCADCSTPILISSSKSSMAGAPPLLSTASLGGHVPPPRSTRHLPGMMLPSHSLNPGPPTGKWCDSCCGPPRELGRAVLTLHQGQPSGRDEFHIMGHRGQRVSTGLRSRTTLAGALPVELWRRS
jgi:hypothetical protein